MSSHIFKELDDTADRVLFIENGRQKDLINIRDLESEEHSSYRLGFKTEEEYQGFLSRTKMKVIHKNKEHLHIDIDVNSKLPDTLFDEISGYDIRYMKYKPFTLESYYTSVTEKGGKISA